ncbi:MAG: alpha-2-macroglobulin, partial [Planctomycetales bacterium]|nr:alpha-2-macroglobulin [Planctomycetales bacterium]
MKTNIDELPDLEEGYPYYRNWTGAPVDAEGNAVFYTAATNWKDAENDGQRWRWALDQVVENNPARRNEVLFHRAQFSHQQFGVQTMNQFGGFRGGRGAGDGDDAGGTYALHTLKENETIARLAAGVKRFQLPDEVNHVKLFQEIAAGDKGTYGQQSLETLANVFQNRRQYPRAAEYWKEDIAQHGPGNNNYRQKALDQIVKNWGRFEGVGTQPAGQKPTVEYTFRNGSKVDFVAQEIKVDQLLDDVKAYLKSDPGQLDWQKINIQDVGYRLVTRGEAKYLGEQAAAWAMDLEPRDNHWDRRVTVAAPLKKPGAYLVTATLADGNVSKIVLWVADTAIVKKQLSGRNYYFVADAVNGRPVKNADLDFFGYQQERLPNGRVRTNTASFAQATDEEGQLMPDPKDLSPNFTWLVTAKNADGRFAFHGFAGVWTGNYYDPEYNQIKVFSITDRPVYRPGQKVQFKFWVRHAQYDQEDNSQFAGRTFPLELYSPKGEKIYEAVVETDDYGGADGVWEIPADATLGQYRLQLNAREGDKWFAQGNGVFRVEEYKKPEFEVTVEGPSEPVKLGETIEATIKAKYFFGEPVANAQVKYTVKRKNDMVSWFPGRPWDWFYGERYWWWGYDYDWYPGFRGWCIPPIGWAQPGPDEVIAENTVPIEPDGTVKVKIDTAPALERWPDSDHRYMIEAEVVDESRRTITGTGSALAAREPFRVYAWVNGGHFRQGDQIGASFHTQTPDGKPVPGMGKATLYRVTYADDGTPTETAVQEWDAEAGADGNGKLDIKAA